MKRTTLFLLLMLLIAVLTACTNQETPIATTYPSPDSADPSKLSDLPTPTVMNYLPGPYPGLYPYPGAEPTAVLMDFSPQPYPGPTGEPTATKVIPTPIIIPTPGSDMGIVIGKLLTSDPDHKPYLASLYLGNTINPDKEGFPPMVSLSEATDPLAVQDETGFFMFMNVKPGFYALIVWNPITSTVIQDEKKENYRIFEVKPGETLDLGEVLFP